MDGQDHEASPEGRDHAGRFLRQYRKAITFEIEYAANGDISYDDQGHPIVYEAQDSDASRLLRFLNAVQQVVDTGHCDDHALKSGIQLFGHEIEATQETAQRALRDVRRSERRYRKQHQIPDEQELTLEQLRAVEDYRAVRSREYHELVGDADGLIRMQKDLLALLRNLGVNTHHAHRLGDDGPARG